MLHDNKSPRLLWSECLKLHWRMEFFLAPLIIAGRAEPPHAQLSNLEKVCHTLAILIVACRDS